jgi:hypothetical protein
VVSMLSLKVWPGWVETCKEKGANQWVVEQAKALWRKVLAGQRSN